MHFTACSIDLTERCNMACDYCFQWCHNRRDLTYDMGKKIINFFLEDFIKSDEYKSGDRSTPEIQWWGGEPLLKFDLMKRLTNYALRKGAQLGLKHITFGGTTNGVLLTLEKLDWLDVHKTFFLVSLDGCRECHDKHRKLANGKGSWDLIMRNLMKAKERWPHLQLRLSPSIETVHHLAHDVKMLHRDYDFKRIFFSPVYEGNWTDDTLAVLREQLDELVEFYNSNPQYGTKHLIEYKTHRDKWKWPYPCGAGRQYVGFGVDGSIWPCHRFNKLTDKRPWYEKEWCIGHVDHGITRPDVRDVFINWDKKPRPWCKGCRCESPCFGQCYATLADLTNAMPKDMPTKPPEHMCKYSKAVFDASDKITRSGSMPDNKDRNCVCYNMCYAEGTDIEIIHSDKSTDMTCICYNTRYSGSLDLNVATKLSDKEE